MFAVDQQINSGRSGGQVTGEGRACASNGKDLRTSITDEWPKVESFDTLTWRMYGGLSHNMRVSTFKLSGPSNNRYQTNIVHAKITTSMVLRCCQVFQEHARPAASPS